MDINFRLNYALIFLTRKRKLPTKKKRKIVKEIIEKFTIRFLIRFANRFERSNALGNTLDEVSKAGNPSLSKSYKAFVYNIVNYNLSARMSH